MPETKTTDQKLQEALSKAVGLAFDGCHKIYVILDDDQFQLQEEYGYGEGGTELIAIGSEAGRKRAARTVREWFDESCGLRFVSAVRMDHDNPNAGYSDIVAQGDDW